LPVVIAATMAAPCSDNVPETFRLMLSLVAVAPERCELGGLLVV
jgi:hypothetical protein